MSLVLLLQIGFPADEVRHKAHAAVLSLLEGQTGSGLQLLSTEGWMHGDEVLAWQANIVRAALAVVQHLVEVARLFELVTGGLPISAGCPPN